MLVTAGKRPRSGALSVAGIGLGFLLGVSCVPNAMAQPLSRVTPVQAGSTTDQLRVYSVADQLIGYLAKAVDWVDRPDTRLPVSALAPKIKAVVLAHPLIPLEHLAAQVVAAAVKVHGLVEVEHLGKAMRVALAVLVLVLITHLAAVVGLAQWA